MVRSPWDQWRFEEETSWGSQYQPVKGLRLGSEPSAESTWKEQHSRQELGLLRGLHRDCPELIPSPGFCPAKAERAIKQELQCPLEMGWSGESWWDHRKVKQELSWELSVWFLGPKLGPQTHREEMKEHRGLEQRARELLLGSLCQWNHWIAELGTKVEFLHQLGQWTLLRSSWDWIDCPKQ